VRWRPLNTAALDTISDVGNLFDPATVTDGSRISKTTGLPVTLANWVASDFIPVVDGQNYTFPQSTDWVAFYDIAQAWLGNVSSAAKTHAAPAGAAFMRVSYNPRTESSSGSGIPLYDYYVVDGTSAPDNILPYGRSLKGDRLAGIPATSLEGGVGPDKLQTFRTGKNLFNHHTSLAGKYVDQYGRETANASYAASTKIRLAPTTVYTANQNMRFVAFFDKNGLSMPTVGITSNTTTFTTPTDAVYARISVTESSKAAFQLEVGSSSTAFEEYKFTAVQTLPDGTPIAYPTGAVTIPRPASYGLERLRETRQRLRSLKYGTTDATARLSIGAFGDSWTHRSSRWIVKLARTLWRKYHASNPNLEEGPIGPGYISFGGIAGHDVGNPNGTVYWNNLMEVISGTWDISAYGTGGGPDICQAVSSSNGDAIVNQGTFNYALGRTFKLLAEGGSGTLRYRYSDAGSWESLDLSALSAGMQVVTLANVPTSGTGRFRIENVSGTITLYGIIHEQPSVPGIVVHKLGATGTRVQQMAAVNATRWQAGVAALGLNLAIVMHGTNDQASRSKAQYKADILTVIDRIRTARPTCDILLVAPCENGLGRALPMTAYAEALYDIARDERDAAYLDLQSFFGVSPSDYSSDSARPWFNSDKTHPEPETGGFAITDAILWAIGERA
jgi:hypothetical protein